MKGVHVTPAGDVERYDPADDAERRGPGTIDPYRGTCGGCGQYVAASQKGGSCIWRGGPWHPACRARDKARGGTWKTAPAESEAGCPTR